MMTTLLLWCITILSRSRAFQYLMPETHAILYHLVHLYSVPKRNCQHEPCHPTLHSIIKTYVRRPSLKY